MPRSCGSAGAPRAAGKAAATPELVVGGALAPPQACRCRASRPRSHFRLPSRPSPSKAAASASSPWSTMSPSWNRIPFATAAPWRRLSQQELEIHAEVLELLSLSVAHDRASLGIGLDCQALLIPADRFGLLGQRRAHPRKRPRGGRQLVRWLVILVESHWVSLWARRWRRVPGTDRRAFPECILARVLCRSNASLMCRSDPCRVSRPRSIRAFASVLSVTVLGLGWFSAASAQAASSISSNWAGYVAVPSQSVQVEPRTAPTFPGFHGGAP